MSLEELLPALNTSLLHEAFTHPSCGEEINNQRLEYLGDAVLGLVISHWLYQCEPPLSEGDMSWLRAALVREDTLGQVAQKLNLGSRIRLAPGMEKEGGREQESILADTLEALLGAVYLSQGFNRSQQVVLEWFAPWLEQVEKHGFSRDAKSRLQENLQARATKFEYVVKKEQGPDHAKQFWVELRIDGKPVAVGRGNSKKEAELHAASQAIENGI